MPIRFVTYVITGVPPICLFFSFNYRQKDRDAAYYDVS
jgi:hypothetical protein